MGLLCPKDGCKREFDSKRAVKQHHYGSHGEKIGKVEVTCDWCGDDFVEWESEIERNTRTFCDNSCFGDWQSHQQQGENNPNWMGGRLNTHTCEVCDSEYDNYKDSDETVCCSKECYIEYLQTLVGEEAFAWKGGRDKYYGKDWQEQRRKAIEESGEQCEECGIPREEYKSISGEDLHVHHIEPFREFEHSEKANKIENLMAVCRDCHYDVEYDRNS